MKKILSILLITAFASSCASVHTANREEFSINSFIQKNESVESYNESEGISDLSSARRRRKEENAIEYIQVYKPNYKSVLWKEDINKLVEKILHSIPPSKRDVYVKLQLQDVSISDFINSIFGEILHLNYVLDDSVKRINKKVTLNLSNKVPLRRFLYLVINILREYGIHIAYDEKDKMFKFFYSKESKFLGIPIYVGDLPREIPGDKTVAYIYPVKYVDITRYFNFINKYIVGGYVVLDYFDNGNFLFALGKAEALRRLLAFLKFIDKPVFKEQNIAVLNLDYIDANDFIEKVKPLLLKEGVQISQRPTEKGLFMYPLRDKLILISPKRSWIDVVLKWKSFLDNPDAIISSDFYVYKPKNRSAIELVELLKSLRNSLTQKEKLTVVLDKTRNQIILNADPKILRVVLKLLKRLDTLPQQVLVETTIAEVTLKDQLQYGLEWYLKNSGYLQGGGGTLGTLGLGAAGFTYSLITKSNKFQLILNAFAKKNLIQILSSPHLVVVNGKSATINVGTEVPVISSEVSAPDITTAEKPSILRNVQYRNTGVQLSIQPSIISTDAVELKINQTVSDAQSNNLSNIDSPIILNRSISTNVVVSNGKSVILGGLISTNYSHTTNEVPILGDIPVLGNLFKTDSRGKTRTELIVIITPYILNSSQSYVKISSDVIRGLRKISNMMR